MDERARLADVTRRLQSAAQAADWTALAAIDRELAQLLRGLRRTGSEQDRAALAQLQRAHSDARARCEHEAARIDEALVQMRTHRDGWMAYAMSDSHDPELDEARR